MKNMGERRNARRVALQSGSCAAVSDPTTVLGRIVDISWKGLLFEYANLDSKPDVHVCDDKMALVGNGIVVKELKFHVIEESPLQQEQTFSLIDMRSVRVMFEDITSAQRMALENYINANLGGYHQGLPKAMIAS